MSKKEILQGQAKYKGSFQLIRAGLTSDNRLQCLLAKGLIEINVTVEDSELNQFFEAR